MVLKQISVFLDNSPGVLSKFTKVLMDNQINMRAISVAETADFGILRILVDKTEECVKVLKSQNYLVSVTEVIAVKIPDKPGGLHIVAQLLGDNDVNIEYFYSTLATSDVAIIIFRVDDNAKASEILKSNGIDLVDKLDV